MFNNVKAKKRITQVIVAFMVICMTVTGSFLLLDDTIREVSAETYNWDVASATDWNSRFGSMSSGNTYNITLTGDITTSAVLTKVPAGATVNLNMNGKTISWASVETGNDNIITKGYQFANTYWGLITNNGSLYITGTGTIKMQQVRYNFDNKSGRDNYGAKVATIVNGSGAYLFLGGNVTVQSYLGQANTGGDKYQDMFLYAHGVYNEGTVDSSAKIDVGTFAGGTVDYNGIVWNQRKSSLYAYSYGIFGGTVNVLGGSINSEAKSGFLDSVSITYPGDNDVANFATGVYSNNAKIMGKTSITTTSTSWRNKEGRDVWGDGTNMSWSVGVMYSKANYPVIGAGVDISSKFSMLANDTFVTLPGSTEGWTVNSQGGPDTAVRRGYAVAGVGADMNAAMYGGQGTETHAIGGNVFGTNSSGSWQDANSTYYYAEDPYYDGLKGTSYATTSSDNVSQSGGNNHETLSSDIRNGAPGETGTQYVIIYRYYDVNNRNPNNLKRVSYSYDSSIMGANDRAVVKIGTTDTQTGIVPNVDNTVAYSKGGTPENSYYYSFAGSSYEAIPPATYVNRDINTPSNWNGGGVLPDAGFAPKTGNMMIVYMDYVIKNATPISVVASNSDVPITEYTTTTAFTVPYTGSALKPGTDFNLGILDAANNNKVVTDVYNISGSGSGSGNDATAVTYEYSADNQTWNNGLPKDVGTYALRVSVNADTTYAASGTYNRQGKQQLISCTITPANVTISGPTSKTVSYGSAFGEIFDFNEYTAKNKSGDVVKGTWSLSGVTLATVPNAGSYENLRIVWTPDSTEGRNYGTTEYPVTLIVNKRAVTVNAGTATVAYGDAAPSFNVKYENLAVADESKQAGWLASTIFEVNYNGTWTEYYQGMPAGTYDLRIKTFGGAEDANNTFSTNSTQDKITVNKRAIVYNAVAADKTYDESADIDVTLTYVSGNYGADPFDSTIRTTGTMVNANAGANKAVTVNTDAITIQNASNYYLVVDNAAALVVNVAKADPTGVSVVANPAAVTYDKAKTLGSSIGLEATENTKIPGTWAWKDSNTVPTASKTSYVAVFTPNDTTNYNTLEQKVNLTVEKAHVEVTVDSIAVTYGDAVPALTGAIKYNGFTGGDTLASIDYEGNTEVSTDYTPGSGVEKKYTISVATNITSENYYFTAKNGTITVNPRALTVTANNASITYGAQTPEFDASDVTATGFYGSDSLNTINATVNVTTTYIPGVVTGKVGTYPINVAVATNNKNYTISYVPGTLTVEKAVLTVTPAPKTVSFGADVPEYKIAGTDYNVTGFVNGDTLARVTITGEPVFTTSYTSESYVNTYPVTSTTINMSADNYTFTGAAGTIRVIKADPSVTTAPAASVVNSHKLAEATFDNSAVVVNPNNGAINVPGTFTFVDGATVPAWGTTNTYTATFTPDDNFNYNTVTVEITVTVTVKTISGTPVIQGSAMAGSTLTVSLVSMDPTTASSYTYQWYVGDTVAATTATYEVKEADIGNTIYVVLDAVEANGFTGTAKSSKTDAVIKALLATTKDQLKVVLPEGIVYDAMSHAATVTIADGYNAQYFGNITVKYNGSDKAPSAAGTYVVTVDVSTPAEPDGGYPENTYYGPATGIAVGSFTIARAPFSVTVYANDKTYDGTVTATAAITGSGLKDENDDVRLAEGARYAFADANVGTNKTINVSNITLIGAQAANYEAVVEPATANITPATLTVRATGVNKTYDGTATVGVTFSNVTGYAPVDSANTVYLTNGTAIAASANAGENILISNIAYELAGSSKDNYVVTISNEGAATVTINKATPVVVAPTINGVVYDSTKPLSTIDLSVYTTTDGYWEFDDKTIVPTVRQKTYAATYYSRNNNYTNLPAAITVNITPKEVILTADSKVVAYGANAPTYTISASGFTGTDSLAMIGGNITATSTYAPGSDIGSYTITINEALTRDNYTFVTVPGSLTVSHGTINVTASAVDRAYNGNANVTVNFTIDSGIYANDDVRLSSASVAGTAATANAGTSAVSYVAPTLVGEKAKNYQLNITPKTGVLTVVISKADVPGNVKFPGMATVEFGYDLSYAIFSTPGEGDGTFAYENAKVTVPGEVGKIYDAYKVIFTPTDSKNYNTMEAVVPVEVIKCTLDYVVGIAGNPQSGQTLTVVTTGLPTMANDFISYQWYRVNGNEITPINGATGKTYVATDADVGYTLAVMTFFDSSSPYVFASGITETVNGIEGIIGESTDAIKEITLTFWQRLMNWLYRIIAILTGIQLGGGLGIGG